MQLQSRWVCQEQMPPLFHWQKRRSIPLSPSLIKFYAAFIFFKNIFMTFMSLQGTIHRTLLLTQVYNEHSLLATGKRRCDETRNFNRCATFSYIVPSHQTESVDHKISVDLFWNEQNILSATFFTEAFLKYSFLIFQTYVQQIKISDRYIYSIVHRPDEEQQQQHDFSFQLNNKLENIATDPCIQMCINDNAPAGSE